MIVFNQMLSMPISGKRTTILILSLFRVREGSQQPVLIVLGVQLVREVPVQEQRFEAFMLSQMGTKRK